MEGIDVAIDWKKLLISLALCALAGIVGSIPIIIDNGVAWKDTLVQPFYAAPNWLFGPVWTLLYFLMALALYLVWLKWPGKDVKFGMALFATQLVLNVLWSYIFFGLQSPTGMLLGLIEILALLAVVIVTTTTFYRVDRRAALLMIPYIIWICFATCLNAGYWWLNH